MKTNTLFRLYTNDNTGQSIFMRDVDGDCTAIHSDDDPQFKSTLKKMHQMIRDNQSVMPLTEDSYLKSLNMIFNYCDENCETEDEEDMNE